MLNSNKIHFGVYLSESKSISIYDNSATTTLTFSIPEGIYFYNHATSSKDIIDTLNTLLSGYCILTAINDRQIKFTFTDTADYFFISDTDDKDNLALLLGCYDNNEVLGDETYSNNDVTQVTAFSFFSTSGYIYNTYNFYGYPDHNQTIKTTKGGISVGASNGEKVNFLDLQLTAIEGSLVSGKYELSTQTTLKTTLNPDDTVNFFTAYSPDKTEPVIYFENDYKTGEFYINKPITKIEMMENNKNYYFNIDLNLVIV